MRVTTFYKMFLKSPSGQNKILFYSFKMKIKKKQEKFNEIVDENFLGTKNKTKVIVFAFCCYNFK